VGLLERLGETDAIVVHVEAGAELTNEHIA
jgi:hypothetical protein